jgi:hypothetical protein
MPTQSTTKKAKRDLAQGKQPSTAAGEFVREEMEHIRRGQHGARSTKQAIAIGLSKARRAGVRLKPPKKGTVSEETRHNAERAYEAGADRKSKKTSTRRSRATEGALKREGHSAASPRALSTQAHRAATKRSPAQRSAAARRAARTKGSAVRSAAARKAARTRAARAS